jgi:hypothetical protein
MRKPITGQWNYDGEKYGKITDHKPTPALVPNK